MSFFKSLFNYGKQALGLGKRNGQFAGLFNKAKDFVSSGLSALNSSPVKSIINSVSSYLPQVGDLYKGFKKYGNIANNVLGGGAERRGERIIRDSPLLMAVDRMGNMQKPSSYADYKDRSSNKKRDKTIERRPRMNVINDGGDYLGDNTLSSLF